MRGEEGAEGGGMREEAGGQGRAGGKRVSGLRQGAAAGPLSR